MGGRINSHGDTAGRDVGHRFQGGTAKGGPKTKKFRRMPGPGENRGRKGLGKHRWSARLSQRFWGRRTRRETEAGGRLTLRQDNTSRIGPPKLRHVREGAPISTGIEDEAGY